MTDSSTTCVSMVEIPHSTPSADRSDSRRIINMRLYSRWKCSTCGYNYETDPNAAGTNCPTCGVPLVCVYRTRTIDVGCGAGPKRPAPGYSAYCDIHPPELVTARPYFQCPMEDMSCFKDKEFDFARAHHVIEHVDDPARACTELIRIARAGIFSFPPPQAEIMFGRRDHNWFVFIDRGRLLFVRKRNPSYGVPRAVTGCELNVDFKWEGSFKFQVIE